MTKRCKKPSPYRVYENSSYIGIIRYIKPGKYKYILSILKGSNQPLNNEKIISETQLVSEKWIDIDDITPYFDYFLL